MLAYFLDRITEILSTDSAQAEVAGLPEAVKRQRDKHETAPRCICADADYFLSLRPNWQSSNPLRSFDLAIRMWRPGLVKSTSNTVSLHFTLDFNGEEFHASVNLKLLNRKESFPQRLGLRKSEY